MDAMRADKFSFYIIKWLLILIFWWFQSCNNGSLKYIIKYGYFRTQLLTECGLFLCNLLLYIHTGYSYAERGGQFFVLHLHLIIFTYLVLSKWFFWFKFIHCVEQYMSFYVLYLKFPLHKACLVHPDSNTYNSVKIKNVSTSCWSLVHATLKALSFTLLGLE